MKSWVEKANAEIVANLSGGKAVVSAKVGEYLIVTCEPFYMAHVFRENQVYFALEKTKPNAKFSKTFERLFDFEKTVKPENKIAETGAYYSKNGKWFLKEYKGDRGATWVNTKLLKDMPPFSTFYQEDKETAEKSVERLPILVIDAHNKPIRIMLPALKL